MVIGPPQLDCTVRTTPARRKANPMHIPPVVKRALTSTAIGLAILAAPLALAGTAEAATTAPAVVSVQSAPVTFTAPAAAARYQVGWWCTGGGITKFINRYDPFAASNVFWWRVVYGMYSCRDGIR